MKDGTPATRPAQMWYSVGTLALLLELGESTVRRRIQEGAFGPPNGDVELVQDYVVDLDGDIRVSTLGYYFYIAAHPYTKIETVRARTVGELRRQVQKEVGSNV
jgi:hypothetical protein